PHACQKPYAVARRLQRCVRPRSGAKPEFLLPMHPEAGRTFVGTRLRLSLATAPVKGASLLVCNGQDTDALSADGVHDIVWETTDQLFPHGAIHQRCSFRIFQDLQHGAFDLVQKRLAESCTARIVVTCRVIEFLLCHRMEGHLAIHVNRALASRKTSSAARGVAAPVSSSS